MYDYINGSVVEINPAELILDNNGIGYRILISLHTYERFQGQKGAKVYIYHLVREDEETLYGFFDKDERSIFTLLLSVSGIGPNTARMMLSSLTPDEISKAIATGDVNKIKTIKGIGIKTAQRAIIELKDKITKGGSPLNLSSINNDNSSRGEAISALILLGFNKNNVEKVVDSIISKESILSLEEIIKKALKIL